MLQTLAVAAQDIGPCEHSQVHMHWTGRLPTAGACNARASSGAARELHWQSHGNNEREHLPIPVKSWGPQLVVMGVSMPPQRKGVDAATSREHADHAGAPHGSSRCAFLYPARTSPSAGAKRPHGDKYATRTALARAMREHRTRHDSPGVDAAAPPSNRHAS